MPGEDDCQVRRTLPRRIAQASDHTGNQGEGGHIIDCRNRNGHGQVPHRQPPRILERAQAAQRRVEQESQVAPHHTRQQISPQDHHRVRVGGEQDEGLLLQQVLLPPDAGEEEEQDEGARGRGKETTNRRMACAARQGGVQGLPKRSRHTRWQQRVTRIYRPWQGYYLCGGRSHLYSQPRLAN